MEGRGIERRDDIERRQRKEMERHVVVSKGKRQERNGRNQDKERNKKKMEPWRTEKSVSWRSERGKWHGEGQLSKCKEGKYDKGKWGRGGGVD